MAIKADTHIHTSFSTDSETSMKEQIFSAYEKGLEHICITDHMDYNFPESALEHPVDGVPFCFDLKEYFKQLATLKKDAPIDVYTGVECGLQREPDVINKNKQLCARSEFDYVIGSLHLINGMDPYYPSFWENQNPDNCIMTYFQTILDNIQLFHDFDSLGHLDYIVRYAPKSYHYEPDKFKKIIQEILQEMIKKEIALEINTSGFKSASGRQNPHETIIKWYLTLGGKLFTIGSDAHSADYLGYHFEDIEKILKKYGIRQYCVFKKRIPTFYDI